VSRELQWVLLIVYILLLIWKYTGHILFHMLRENVLERRLKRQKSTWEPRERWCDHLYLHRRLILTQFFVCHNICQLNLILIHLNWCWSYCLKGKKINKIPRKEEIFAKFFNFFLKAGDNMKCIKNRKTKLLSTKSSKSYSSFQLYCLFNQKPCFSLYVINCSQEV
jgi:hypothetical protein